MICCILCKKELGSTVQQIYSNFKPSCQINSGHIKVPQNKFWYNNYVGNKKNIGFKCVSVTRPDLSGVPLICHLVPAF